ncbi:PREDICTED: late embryogenesis abundant protein At1g64065-like [Nelumbo nucifera]|uniref:Late embryogenesis abundant protein At1g64065-like n=2 Tax=Nelumbo nucifera TaxID=4432 RepID=A0A1U7ZTE3_NELNU|nr:PREDICTED: late embryogenesis abundant protein At1g64065-like [Nelumbo nucifera]DAD43219.1 TPA_asm: hypothetical protein HUJ06_001449 [Nelumbo nucifera]
MLEAQKHRRMQNMKCYAYIAAFAVFQTIIILVFALTVLKIKTPSVKLTSVTVDRLNSATTPSPSFNMTLTAEIAVKNKNFGHFKFDNSTATVSYGGTAVGEAFVPMARAKARKTRRMNITMEVTSERLSGVTNLSNDLSSGTLTLNSYAKLSGKVHLMKIMKKRKSAEMNCTIAVNLGSKTIQKVECE